ncbi:class I SAM-dependent RNA methyltransferase [Mycoplasma procyoni]|uniref:class I SAM-dependent RNA methyltransferase n=1 Tax=Mycoplasma procyoni TaxID=568784 RepID=UPI00197B2BE1|nr:methyltransferase domain-containing protein [Mycoplasma procyoni]MBN3534565.1 class I SAM-dependent RNA methyltransferase [Mycoplasma procyoni]
MPSTKIVYYNQKGEGVGIYNQKPVYLPFSILGEEVEFEVIQQKEKYYIGKVSKLIKASKNRNYNLPEGVEYIGGYELMHMNKEAEKEYKIYNIKNLFKGKIPVEQLENIEYFAGQKELRYRNKITLFDGGLKKKNTNEIYYLDDFLLSEIKPKTDKKGKIILRQLDSLIVGKKSDNLFTTDTLGDFKFKVGIGSFYQVNKEVTLEAYNTIISFIEQGDNVLDLYSGIGTISAFASKKAKAVIGVEVNKSSFKNALENKEINKLDNVEFVNASVEKFLSQYKNTQNTTLIVDPDRTGLKKEVVDKIANLDFKRIIYLSCNPATQVNDIAALSKKYQIKFMKIFNMFPKTYHIENLVVLEKINN